MCTSCSVASLMHRTAVTLIRKKANTGYFGLFRRQLKSRTVPDPGLTPAARGDTSLTDPAEYRSNDGAFRSAAALHKVASRTAQPFGDSDVPLTSSPRPEVGRKEMSLLSADDKRRVNTRLKFPMTPSRQAYTIMAAAASLDKSDESSVVALRDKLAREHGVFGSQRMDAYMLDDETLFPNWVRQLNPRIRSQVMYGGIGVNEDDEVVRENLSRLPEDERRAEWFRIKAAKSAELGEEKPLSPLAIRNERMSRRKHFALANLRAEREANVRRMALREQPKWTAPASGRIDFSLRLAVVAKHVEANVKTDGKWPLDEERLTQAVKRQRRASAEATFMRPGLGSGLANAADRVSPALREAIKTVGAPDPLVKRTSRRLYAFRLTAVRNGHQDEHGRKFQQLSRLGRQRVTALRDEAEFAVDASRMKRVNPNSRGKEPTFASKWPGQYQLQSKKGELGRNTHVDSSSRPEVA